jgi:hypothetical protein
MSWVERTTAARAGRRLKIKAAETRLLKAQIHAYQVNLKHANEAMQRLEDDLAKLHQERESMQFLKSPADRIIAAIRQNSNCPPQGRRDSLETLVWARGIHDISPSMWIWISEVTSIQKTSSNVVSGLSNLVFSSQGVLLLLKQYIDRFRV